MTYITGFLVLPLGHPPGAGLLGESGQNQFFSKNGQVVCQTECHDQSVAFTIKIIPRGHIWGSGGGKKGVG